MSKIPEWFALCDPSIEATNRRISESLVDSNRSFALKIIPQQAHWFINDTLLLANRANREGMHANALAATRQCIEAISIIELGLSESSETDDVLGQWWEGRLTPGQLRRWLSLNLWPGYGCGLWQEPWGDFMARLASAVQAYSHYTPQLAQWQMHLLGRPNEDEPSILHARIAPRAYDPQKATRITLYHAIIGYALGRIWAHSNPDDAEFNAEMNRFRVALGKSEYLDGHATDWDQQFWALLFSTESGSTILE